MINTYQTSMAAPPPPPPPPRGHATGSHTVLIPATLPSRGHSKYLIRFLVAVVMLHLLLSVAGFIFLYHFEHMGRLSSSTPRAESQKSEKQESSQRALAQMVVDRSTAKTTTPGFLQWDMDHSVLLRVNYFHKSWVTVLQPGHYHVSSRVTFSRAAPPGPLFSRVLLRRSGTEEKEEVLMQAYCSLGGGGVCTASQGAVVELKEGDQLGVWTEDRSRVDYDDKATAFGMYSL